MTNPRSILSSSTGYASEHGERTSSRCRSRRGPAGRPASRSAPSDLVDDLELAERQDSVSSMTSHSGGMPAGGRAGRWRREAPGRAGCAGETLTATGSRKPACRHSSRGGQRLVEHRVGERGELAGRSTASRNRSGVRSPRSGWCQRVSASAAIDLTAAEVDDRLEVDDELLLGDGARQVAAEGEASRHRRCRGRARTPTTRWPSRFAWYIATSARRSSSSMPPLPWRGRCRRPASTLIRMLSSSIGAARARRARLGAGLGHGRADQADAAAPRTRRRRAGRPGRPAGPRGASRWATSTSTRSPAAWPSVSLTSLKWLRSIRSRAATPPGRPAKDSSAPYSHEPAPVGQAGERVLGGGAGVAVGQPLRSRRTRRRCGPRCTGRRRTSAACTARARAA